MTSWSSTRTEVIKAADIQEEDRIMDPEGRGILSVFAVERFTSNPAAIWVHAVARRRVLRKFWASQDIERCIPR